MPLPAVNSETSRLSKAAIIAAACQTIEEDGYDSFTMRALGRRLGADATAIYRYFQSKEELILGIAEALFEEVVGYSLAGNWRERLDELWVRIRKVSLAHPTLVPFLVHANEERRGLITFNEIIVSALMDAGLKGQRLGMFHQLLLTVMTGEGLLEASWNPDAQADRARARRFYGSLPPDTYPAMASSAPWMFPDLGSFDTFIRRHVLDMVESAGQAPQ